MNHFQKLVLHQTLHCAKIHLYVIYGTLYIYKFLHEVISDVIPFLKMVHVIFEPFCKPIFFSQILCHVVDIVL